MTAIIPYAGGIHRFVLIEVSTASRPLRLSGRIPGEGHASPAGHHCIPHDHRGLAMSGISLAGLGTTKPREEPIVLDR